MFEKEYINHKEESLYVYYIENNNVIVDKLNKTVYPFGETVDQLNKIVDITKTLIENSLDNETIDLKGEIHIDFAGNYDKLTPDKKLFLLFNDYNSDKEFNLFPNHSFQDIILGDTLETKTWSSFIQEIESHNKISSTQKGYGGERYFPYYMENTVSIPLIETSKATVNILTHLELIFNLVKNEKLDYKITNDFITDIDYLSKYNFYIDYDRKPSHVGFFQSKYFFFLKKPVIIVMPTLQEFFTKELIDKQHVLIAKDFDDVLNCVEILNTDVELYNHLVNTSYEYALQNFTYDSIKNKVKQLLLNSLS